MTKWIRGWKETVKKKAQKNKNISTASEQTEQQGRAMDAEGIQSVAARKEEMGVFLSFK